MRPGNYALTLYRGDSYSWRFMLWSDSAMSMPVDLTDATAKAEIRESPGSARLMTLTCAITLPNNIDVNLPAAAWATYTATQGRWDLQLTYPSGYVFTVVAGAVTITADITDSAPALTRGARR